LHQSFLSGAKVDAKVLIMLILYWVEDTPYKIIQKDLGLSRQTIVSWFTLFREECVNDANVNHCQIGGDGHIVQIDEASFSKRKYNRGRIVGN
jgi:hypothetical protein